MPTTMPEQNCRSCSRPVYWVTYAKTGKPMILDVGPLVRSGTRFRHPDDRLIDDVPWILCAGDELGHPSHFATCPDSARWRRR